MKKLIQARSENLQVLSRKLKISSSIIAEILSNKDQNIRSVLNTNNPQKIAEQEENLMNILHALAKLYTSANFDKLHEEDLLFLMSECSQFVINHFAGLSLPEIKLAFRLAASGSIKADLRAFNSAFTVSMLGDILKNYQKYRNNVIYAHNSYLDQKAYEEDETAKKARKKLNFEAMNETIEIFNKLKADFNSGKEVTIEQIKSYWLDILKKAGLIKADKSIQKKLFQEAIIIAKNNLVKDRMNDPINISHILKKADDGIYTDNYKRKTEVIFNKLLVLYAIKNNDF